MTGLKPVLWRVRVAAVDDVAVSGERLSFFVEAVQAVAGGWRLAGEPGYQQRHWARPGDRFDRSCGEDGHQEREVDLVVVELTGAYAIVTGTGGDLLRAGDIVSGQRSSEDTDRAGTASRQPSEAVDRLARILGLPTSPARAGSGPRWSAVKTTLGSPLPADYMTFVDAYGAGTVDDHLFVCVPDPAEAWADLVEQNSYAHECVRLDFAGPDGCSGDWPLGDPSRWAPGRADVPGWFEPGDDLISWGYTGNGDFLFWHVQPGTPPDDWPVVLKERGPAWERYRTGFAATLTGLLTGEIKSDYLSHRLIGPHLYHR